MLSSKHRLPDDQGPFVTVGLQLPVGDLEGVQETGARGRDVEAGRVRRDAELVLDDAGGGRQGQVGRAGGDDEQVDVGGADLGVGERRAGRLDGEVGAGLVRRGDAAFPDARAAEDPFIGGVDDLGEVFVGEHLGGRIGSDSGDDD